MENLHKSDVQWRAIQERNGKKIRRTNRKQKFSSKRIFQPQTPQTVLIPGEDFPVSGEGFTFNPGA
jgi:hypothetical protein